MVSVNGVRLVEVYDNDRAQAMEMARALGGEAERLLLAIDRADDVSDEIWSIRERDELHYLIFEVGYDAYEAFIGFCEAGAVHWEGVSMRARSALCALEVTP